MSYVVTQPESLKTARLFAGAALVFGHAAAAHHIFATDSTSRARYRKVIEAADAIAAG